MLSIEKINVEIKKAEQTKAVCKNLPGIKNALITARMNERIKTLKEVCA
jgi:hypothetical protein